MKTKHIIIIGLGLALIIAFFISRFASSSPDGLERIAEDLGFIDKASEAEAWEGSPAPDYAVPGVEDEGLSTGLAGILGTLIVLAAAVLVGIFIKRKPAGK